MSSARNEPVHLPGHLDHSRLQNLLGYRLAQASIPTDNIFRNRIAAVHAVNKLEFSILMLLMSNLEVTPKRLAVALNIPGSNLTLLLDRLEQRGLLIRARSAGDRRVQHILLTPDGERLVAELQVSANSMEAELLKHLSKAEQAMLFELLGKLSVHRKV